MTQVWKDVDGHPVPVGFTSMPIPRQSGKFIKVPQRAELSAAYTPKDRAFARYSLWETDVVAWPEHMDGVVVLKARDHHVPEDLPGWEPLPPWPKVRANLC